MVNNKLIDLNQKKLVKQAQNKAIEQILDAARILGWDLALLQGPDSIMINGLIIGKPKFLEDNVRNLNLFEIYNFNGDRSNN